MAAATTLPAEFRLPADFFQKAQGTNATTAEIEDAKGALLARCSVVRVTDRLGYVVTDATAASLGSKAVVVREKSEGEPLKLVVEGVEEPENRRLLPIYMQAHHAAKARRAEEHLVDALVEHAIGRDKFDLKKNFTVDLLEEDGYFRDALGFLVTDRQQFALNSYDAQRLRQLLNVVSDVKTEVLAHGSEPSDEFLDFDESIAGVSRDTLWRQLIATPGVEVRVARRGQTLSGLLCTLGGEQVRALYASDAAVADTLLAAHLDAGNNSKLKAVRLASAGATARWADALTSRQSVFRRHTRAVPANIAWGQVYALNIGVHIV